MATIYTSDSLRNIFQSSFNLTQWYSFSQHFFNASEIKLLNDYYSMSESSKKSPYVFFLGRFVE